MRWSLVPLLAALFLLTGCHELWGDSSSSSQSSATVTYSPAGDSSVALTNLRASIPAVEAWYADHGTYAGMTVNKLHTQYDYGISLDLKIARATTKPYCLESTLPGETWSYVGPTPRPRSGELLSAPEHDCRRGSRPLGGVRRHSSRRVRVLVRERFVRRRSKVRGRPGRRGGDRRRLGAPQRSSALRVLSERGLVRPPKSYGEGVDVCRRDRRGDALRTDRALDRRADNRPTGGRLHGLVVRSGALAR